MCLSVVFDPVDGDHQITRNNTVLTVIKCDDVGVVIVLKVGFVHFEQVRVCAENNPDFSNAFFMCCSKGLNPGSDFAPIWTPKAVVGIVKLECQGN